MTTTETRAEWRRHPVRVASQCRVSVLGLGRVGQAIIKVLTPLGYPISGWSRHARTIPGVKNFVGTHELPQLLEQTDVLICALPLTIETRGILNEQTLSQLPHGSFVINVGRGEHLIENDLRHLLNKNHLAGAALDVFEREPPLATNWVWAHPNVIATPHIAAQASFEIVARQCVDALRRERDKLPQRLAIDRILGY